MKLNNYLQDGANYQAKAVLAYLTSHDGIEESWSDDWKGYKAEPKIARWENCREQGYIVYLRSENFSRQINIAFFEHRNSDSICAVKWEQYSINSLTIDSADFERIYKNKWDVSFSVGYGEVVKMADWVYEQLSAFWIAQKEGNENEKI